MLTVGEDLGPYELIAHLKNGGMASLYLGRRKRPPDNRIFAIKVVHAHYLDDEELSTMFRDEAGLSVLIDHPNVVGVEEVGEDRGRHYLAMEYIHGCSLAQLLQALIRRRRRMSPELATYVAMSIAEGLHAAHETRGPNGERLNVVHRDVSPQNILLSHTGEIKLIDFGIAKSRMRVHHSQTGAAIKGKLRYMSPEHASGDPVDRRTDVYALGIILWEMLTMRPLFWSESDFGMLSQIRDPKIEPPSRFASRIGDALDRAVLRALSPERDGRPPTALAFRRILSGAVPFADAMDEEQVSELLHVMLGDEFSRKRDRLPQIVALELGDVPARDSMPEVLDTLTEPGQDSSLLQKSLAEETSDNKGPSPGADDLGSTGAPSADDAITVDSDSDPPEEDGPTELMDYESIHHLIDGAAGAQAPAPAGESMAYVSAGSSAPPTDPQGLVPPAAAFVPSVPRPPLTPSPLGQSEYDVPTETPDLPPSYLPALAAVGVVAFLIVVIALFTFV